MEAKNTIHFPDSNIVSANDILSTFLSKWSLAEIQKSFWDTFRLAVQGGLEKDSETLSPEKLALLFDDLLEVMTALKQQTHSLNTINDPKHLALKKKEDHG